MVVARAQHTRPKRPESEKSQNKNNNNNNYPPRRLNRLVKVLPQPGTGHLKMASFRRLLALAACVAVVVTCCFSTWRMGGSRTAPLPIASAGAMEGLDDRAPEPEAAGSSAARKAPGEEDECASATCAAWGPGESGSEWARDGRDQEGGPRGYDDPWGTYGWE